MPHVFDYNYDSSPKMRSEHTAELDPIESPFEPTRDSRNHTVNETTRPRPNGSPGSFRQRIIVTGSNCSGTTILGQVLAAAPGLVYANEPFSPDHGLKCIDRPFLYLQEGLPVERKVKPGLDAFMSGRGRFRRRSTGRGEPLRHRLFRRYFSSWNHLRYSFDSMAHPSGTLLIKDPLALLSSAYLCRNYSCQAVVLVRHPCAYYASLKRMNWTMSPNVLLDQSEFARRYLPEYSTSPDSRYNRDPLTAAAYVWLFLYTAASRFCDENENIVMRKHEDLSLLPFEEVESLCGTLNLPYTAKMKRRIQRMTSNRNPAEAGSQTHSLRSGSAGNAFLWRTKPQQWEVDAIMKICGRLSEKWY